MLTAKNNQQSELYILIMLIAACYNYTQKGEICKNRHSIPSAGLILEIPCGTMLA